MNELLSLRSDLPFKGSREYLQGPDTYNWLAGLLAPLVGDSAPLTLTFRRLTGRQMEIARHAEFSADPRVVGEFFVPGGDARFVLIETDQIPTRRIPYDEDAIIAACAVEDQEIVASRSTPGYTPIELCVAMTKALHHAALPQEKRKWLFARLELARLFHPIDCEGLKVHIVQRVETRFTKSAIVAKGELLGHIYFSRSRVMSVLVDIASYVPSGRLDNLPSCERFAIQPQFLDEKIGTREVARLEGGEDTTTMATAASRRLLDKTGFAVSEISCLVVCTQNPAGHGIPHTSAQVHHEMKMSDAVACFDISLGCSGYVYGLSVMAGFLESNDLDNGVLITADPYSPILNPDDKNTVLLFGDAATASLVRRGRSGGWELGKFLFATRGAAGEAIRKHSGVLEMKGREVFEFCLREVPLQIRALLQQSGLSADDVDAFVLHQGSKFIVEQVARALGLPSAKVPLFLEGIGNTVSSSIPLVLEHKVFPGSCRRVLLSGFGVGLSWASGLLEQRN